MEYSMKSFILIMLMIFSTAVFAKHHHHGDGYHHGHHRGHHHSSHHGHHHGSSGIYFYGPGSYYGKTPGYRYYRDGTIKRCWYQHGRKYCRYYYRY